MNTGEALHLHPGVKVRPCEWGYGVFTDEFIKAGDLIEECRYLKVLQKHTRHPPLDDYVFQIRWSEREQQPAGDWVALVLGYGMLYNHAKEPNAAYYRAVDRDLFTFYALRDIHPGEQVFISYGDEWWDSRGQGVPP
ncbi:SET domain-containing protein-lysine N-methyltransferase [Myxococcus sp. K15C18031901]|uniref:SET domain-containing protein-lysine N-methyltransferase n=1 Tax=Myxococcus dinghuensis TaxID=2906761 RepID=UPI0020A7AE58|nr:SET domain-containing protein-lysine N-methyltransferase [Myxococcus dinghuensis]MCP3103256.1 SET domain-containing protein-lysine N-methyltransferase [Myxococcus dinghuensis]